MVNVPSISEAEVVAIEPVKSNPVGNVTTTLPSKGNVFDIVKPTVTLPLSPATKLIGVTDTLDKAPLSTILCI